MHENRLIVVGHYYPNREGNLFHIIDDLIQLGHRILVWDNNPQHQWNAPTYLRGLEPLVQIVRCPNNPIHGRYLATLIYPTIDYFLFQDDDMVLGWDLIENLFCAAEAGESDKFYGLEGRALDLTSDHPYWNAKAPRYPEKADMVIRAYACHRMAVLPGLNDIAKFGIEPGRSETILMSYGRSVMVDCAGLDWTNLPENGIGLSHDVKTHHDEIEAFFNKYIKP